ncbi:hypothetical protein EYZ11_011914 [Aspergillus tanneri]|uniref:Uncharacterized protein n=1 Tax=Aspergillus tanneri TaxID=1220188 RepID=A0A4S3J1M4_9EURO|nr:uncharacterized protein ATNIH1004_000328 [Aspergillus tanneri]KAA8651445.1 hypothetical protein ATNIH1004_000328 [Aspergillus tanneri]THC88636.1 hypothetical protein EYZ11_011914 [Aspergillus tanneri]
MVLGLLAIAAFPTVTGVSLAASEQRKANQRREDERRMRRFNIDVESAGETQEDSEVQGKRVVLRDEMIYIDDPDPSNRETPSHTSQAFYVEYPELEHMKHLGRGLGLVTTVTDSPPLLHWIYADKNTHGLKCGNRTASAEHVVGPWDWADDEETITLEENRKFVAVQEDNRAWVVYFDRDKDDLERVLEEQGKLDNAYAPIVLKRTMVLQTA